MARIAGVDLPREKRIEVGLTYVYGIGQSTADEILAGTGINPDTRVKDLTADEEAKIRDYIDKNNISATVVCAIARVFPAAASAPRPMRVPAKVPSALSRTKRSKEELRHGC